MDCIVHGVSKSQTRLSDFHFHKHLWAIRNMNLFIYFPLFQNTYKMLILRWDFALKDKRSECPKPACSHAYPGLCREAWVGFLRREWSVSCLERGSNFRRLLQGCQHLHTPCFLFMCLTASAKYSLAWTKLQISCASVLVGACYQAWNVLVMILWGVDCIFLCPSYVPRYTEPHSDCSYVLGQRSPTFWHPGTDWEEDSLSTDRAWQGVGVGVWMIQAHYIYCALFPW